MTKEMKYKVGDRVRMKTMDFGLRAEDGFGDVIELLPQANEEGFIIQFVRDEEGLGEFKHSDYRLISPLIEHMGFYVMENNIELLESS